VTAETFSETEPFYLNTEMVVKRGFCVFRWSGLALAGAGPNARPGRGAQCKS